MTTSQPSCATPDLLPLDVAALEELLPMARRLARGDATALVRVQARAGVVAGFAVAASGALVGRRLAAATPVQLDITVLAADLSAWVEHARSVGEEGHVGALRIPQRRDGEWRGALPPALGWTVLDTVPESVISTLVAEGIAAHREAERLALNSSAARQLLDQSVLTVSGGRRPSGGLQMSGGIQTSSGLQTSGGLQSSGALQTDTALVARITNRSLSALVSMAFLPSGGAASVAVAGRWTRVAAAFGSVWTEDATAGFGLL